MPFRRRTQPRRGIAAPRCPSAGRTSWRRTCRAEWRCPCPYRSLPTPRGAAWHPHIRVRHIRPLRAVPRPAGSRLPWVRRKVPFGYSRGARPRRETAPRHRPAAGRLCDPGHRPPFAGRRRRAVRPPSRQADRRLGEWRPHRPVAPTGRTGRRGPGRPGNCRSRPARLHVPIRRSARPARTGRQRRRHRRECRPRHSCRPPCRCPHRRAFFETAWHPAHSTPCPHRRRKPPCGYVPGSAARPLRRAPRPAGREPRLSAYPPQRRHAGRKAPP